MIRSTYIKTGALALASLCLVFAIVLFPKQAYEASLRGLTLWWDVVFPSLLPFFITAELLMGFGVVHFIGVWLEPLMRPLFRIPGVGGFVMAMGVSSGYPMGAKLTVKLREQKLVTKSEGERLLAISSTSGPLFMIGAVAVGFFHNATLGILIAAAHYVAALIVGLIMRFHSYRNEPHNENQQNPSRSILYRALQAMHRARVQDGRSLGTLMGEAITSAIQTLLMIGGFIIIFSVLLSIMHLIRLDQIFFFIASLILIPMGFPAELISSLFAGLFEITLGSQLASASSSAIPLILKTAIACSIISWSGLSVHAQVASMIAKTDLSYKPYLLARFFHAIFAFLCVLLLWEPFQSFIKQASLPTTSMLEQIKYWSPQSYFIGSVSISGLFLCLCFLTIYLPYRRSFRKRA
ncbi:sporulation integral membrane protein YlbJ [Bacillus horti]|uniref:Sporulation integral membrane protein YlbJ n=1 Tax=Caldalkalibacillus horti TaxID=77523 RepID=A0ABT9VUB6_9BACI|nr:sporulation integral membrane protein YlbJ [Bacillus horti]MDQ0164575.1 sporulation integral membrane protein YlbJ [Bacillus horti]